MGVLTPTPDATLVRRCRAGHPEAFEALIRRHQRTATAVALATGIRPDTLPDVLQETFLQAFRDLPSLQKPQSFGPWLLAITRNAARMSLRGKRPIPTPSLDTLQTAPPRESDMTEFSKHLRAQVEALPEGIREAIFLYYYEGESVRKVARTLGTTRSAIKNRLHKGRAILREKLWRDLRDSLREMMPSTRDWNRDARRLALGVLAVIPTRRAEAGGVLMASAKAITVTIVGATLIAIGGIAIHRSTQSPPTPPPVEVASTVEERETPLLPDERPRETPPPDPAQPPEVKTPEDAEVPSLLVRVVDDAGVAFPGASVGIQAPGKERIFGKTDTQGLARFENLPKDPLTVSVGTPDPEYALPPSRKVVPAGQEIEFVMMRAALVRGVVVTPQNTPLPKMHVLTSLVLDDPEANPPRIDMTIIKMVKFQGHHPRWEVKEDRRLWVTIITEEDGTFAFTCPPGFKFDFVVPGLRHAPRAADGRETTPYSGARFGVMAPAPDLVIHTVESAMDGCLTVRVLNPDGTPARSVTASASFKGDPRGGIRRKTDDEGRALMEGLPRGGVSLGASPTWVQYSDDFLHGEECVLPSESVEVVPEGQEVVIHLRRGVLLKGRVLTPGGEGAPARILAEAGDEGRHAVSLEGGGFVIRVPPGHTWTLVASSPPVGKAPKYRGNADRVTELGDPVVIHLLPEE